MAATGHLQVDSVAIDDVRREWEELAHAGSNPFATVEWAETWLEHANPLMTPRIFVARRADGTVAAILPFVLGRGRYVRKLRFLGYGAANELGPICRPDDQKTGVTALRRVLEETRGEWDVFLGENLPGAGWSTALGATLVAKIGNPVVQGSWGTWDDYLASRTQRFRGELRSHERKLAERGLGYRAVTSREALDPALDLLFELHRARWQEEASPYFAGLEALHRSFAAVALERGWLRLHLLELEGRAAAVFLGYRFGCSAWSYQVGRETEAPRSAPLGIVITAHAIREALAEGVSEFNLGPGAQHYKVRFATRDTGLETVAAGRGLRGRAAVIAARRRER